MVCVHNKNAEAINVQTGVMCSDTAHKGPGMVVLAIAACTRMPSQE